MPDKSDIPMSEYPHLRRQYREYKRMKISQGGETLRLGKNG